MRYEEYKSTELEWLPQIPSHWEWRYLSQAAKEQKIKKPAGEMFPVMSLSYGNIIRKKNIDAGLVPENYDNYQLLHKGNIVLRFTDLQNDHTSLRTGLVKEVGIITSAYTCLQPTENPEFLHYLLHAYDLMKVFYGFGGGVRQSIGFKDVRNLFIPIPSRTEQDQIVRYLDWQVSKINKLIAAKKKEISLLDERQRSFVCSLVVNGTNPSCKKKASGINWAEEIPEEWDVLYLSQVSNERSVKNTGMVENNLLSLSYGHIVNKDINTTEGLLPASFEGYQIVLPGNIVLRLTDLQNDHKSLRVGLSAQKGIITSAYTCINVHDNILPEYLYLQLHAADLCKVFYGMGGGVRQSIGYKDIRKMLIAVPPLAEQERIVKILKESDTPTEAIISKLNDEIKKLEELKARIISDAVTGQIDVRGVEIPEYEYVEEENDESEEDSDGEIEEQEEE